MPNERRPLVPISHDLNPPPQASPQLRNPFSVRGSEAFDAAGVQRSHPFQAAGDALAIADLHDLPGSENLAAASPSLTCCVSAGTIFGKSAGVGTAVSEMHKDLHGTGIPGVLMLSTSLPSRLVQASVILALRWWRSRA